MKKWRNKNGNISKTDQKGINWMYSRKKKNVLLEIESNGRERMTKNESRRVGRSKNHMRHGRLCNRKIFYF